LAELERMNAPEIAEIIGTNVTTVHARLRDARRKFRTLAHHYHDECATTDGRGDEPVRAR